MTPFLSRSTLELTLCLSLYIFQISLESSKTNKAQQERREKTKQKVKETSDKESERNHY